MSTALRSSVAAPLTRSERSRLRLVTPALARRRTPLSIVIVGTLLLGLVAVLLINILISHSSYRVEQLQTQQQRLHEERDRLTEDISYRQSPQNITAGAEKQGMKQDTQPSFVRLSDGKILETGKGTAPSKGSAEKVPGPRADTRQDVRPNLRSDEKLPAVGDAGAEELSPPSLTAPR